MADPTPARYTWTYEPLPAGDPPSVVIDLTPDAVTCSLDALFTFHADEPDVTFECRVDTNPYEPCGFEGAMFADRGAFEWGLEENEVGRHTFRVRATDFEGNVGQPTTYTWRLLGVVTQFLSGPGFTPGTEGEPPTGGEVATSEATIDFIANVSDATYECSLDLEPYAPCTPPVTYTDLGVGEHALSVIATDLARGRGDGGRGLRVGGPRVQRHHAAADVDRARAASGTSSTIFEFDGTDNLTPAALITFECRLDCTSELDWAVCESPYNLLDTYTYEDPQMAPGEHTFEVRAVDDVEPLVPDPSNPKFEGNVDPTPVPYSGCRSRTRPRPAPRSWPARRAWSATSRRRSSSPAPTTPRPPWS